jgi:signal transduction histidine kinase
VLEAATRSTVTVLVIDRSTSLVIEQKDDSQLDLAKAIGVATYSTRNSMVLANVRFFESLWEEVELLERERDALGREIRSRRTAELLQDILSHDVRNYNQVSLSSAELLRESISGNESRLGEAAALVDAVAKEAGPSGETIRRAEALREVLRANAKALSEAKTLVETINKATGGSTDLIDRTKILGKIMSQEDIQLLPVEVGTSIGRSIALVIAANPKRSITPSLSLAPGAKVVADDMLEEVFTNVLSNSVHYTDADGVQVEIEVKEARLEKKPGRYWKISFSDHGRGIPDELKQHLFERYLKKASGTGLGLSIAHALAVERYSGELRIADRVEGDRTKGTRVELWLQMAH